MLKSQGSAAGLVTTTVPQTITATTNGAWVDVRTLQGELMLVQLTGAVSGTTPSMVTTIQDATDSGGTGAANIPGAAFPAVSTANQTQKLMIDPRLSRGFIRAVHTVTGTSPSFAVALVAAAKPQVV